MKIRISEGDHPEIELCASETEWSALAQAILEDEIIIPCESEGDPRPYSRLGRQIAVHHVPGPKVQFTLSDSGILIAGDPKYFETLSRVMSALAIARAPGYHIHIDYEANNHYIGARSVPVVFCRSGD